MQQVRVNHIKFYIRDRNIPSEKGSNHSFFYPSDNKSESRVKDNPTFTKEFNLTWMKIGSAYPHHLVN